MESVVLKTGNLPPTGNARRDIQKQFIEGVSRSFVTLVSLCGKK